MNENKVSKFHVKFYDANAKFLHRTYKNSVQLNCTEKEYMRCIDEHISEIDKLETTYGILDFDGTQLANRSWDMGYNSYEISYKNAPKVWNELCKILTPYIIK